jgi:hypothetical protein
MRETYGNFCDPSITNMEDWLINHRLSKQVEVVWRGLVRRGAVAEVVIGARDWTDVGSPDEVFYDAVWRSASDGASSNGLTLDRDVRLTTACLVREAESLLAPRQAQKLVRARWPGPVPLLTFTALLAPTHIDVPILAPTLGAVRYVSRALEAPPLGEEGPLPRRRKVDGGSPPKQAPEWSLRGGARKP